jgi:hypothetical protein
MIRNSKWKVLKYFEEVLDLYYNDNAKEKI